MTPQTKQLVEAAKAVLNRNKPVDQIYRDLDKLQEAITAYEQSESSSRQQENDESDKTKTGIWRKWDSKPDLSYNEAAYGAMLEYAHQQTADKDREIEELKAEVTALKLVIDELTDGDCLKQSKAKLSGEIVKLKAEAERLRKDDGWVSIDNEKPLPDKACQCYCPDEPIDVIQIAFWDDKFGFVDNNDCPVNATKWKYIKIY